VRPSRITAILASAALGSLAVAACSSGGGSSQASSSSAPINIMTISTVNSPDESLPETQTAGQAAVNAINAAGGINGHKINWTFCDDEFNPNTAVNCAREAVSDHDAAVVGSYETFSPVWTTLQAAGIPYIGGAGEVPIEETSPISFPLNAGQSEGINVAGAAEMIAAGAKHIAIITCSVPGCQDAANGLAAAIKQYAGLSVVRIVSAPVTAASFSAQAAEVVSGGVDAVDLAVPPPMAATVITEIEQTGYKGMIGTSDSVVANGVISALGSKANGLYLASGLTPVDDTSNPTIAKFISEMNAVNPKADKDEVALTTWTAVYLFADVAKTLSSVTAKTVLNAFEHLSKPVDLGDTSPYSVVGKVSPISAYPRIFNPSVDFNRVVNGKLVTTVSNVDPWTELREHANG
jgi:branched-chain amino acid transport system substrate-binding protein